MQSFTNDFRTPGKDGRPATGANWTSMPEYFKQNGYITLGGGKTYHPGLPPNYDEPLSWSQELPYFPFNEVGCGTIP